MKLSHKAKELIFGDPAFLEAMNKVRRLVDQFPESNNNNNNNNNYHADTQSLVRIAAHILEQENKL
jgi:hypothetical protein